MWLELGLSLNAPEVMGQGGVGVVQAVIPDSTSRCVAIPRVAVPVGRVSLGPLLWRPVFLPGPPQSSDQRPHKLPGTWYCREGIAVGLEWGAPVTGVMLPDQIGGKGWNLRAIP